MGRRFVALWLALVLALPAMAGAQNRVNVDKIGGQDPPLTPCANGATKTSVDVSLSAGTTVFQFAPAAAGVRVYFCGGQLRLGGAATATIKSGASSDCTTSTPITFMTLVATEDEFVLNMQSDVSLTRGTLAHGFCLTRSASVTAKGFLIVSLVTEP